MKFPDLDETCATSSGGKSAPPLSYLIPLSPNLNFALAYFGLSWWQDIPDQQ
jgi:hypothetical protein